MNALVDYGSDSSSEASPSNSPEIKKISNPDVPSINAPQNPINHSNDEMTDSIDAKKDWRQHYSDSEEPDATKDDSARPQANESNSTVDTNNENGVDYSNFERITEFDDAVDFAKYIYKNANIPADDLVPPEIIPLTSEAKLEANTLKVHVNHLLNIKEKSGISLSDSIMNRKSFKNPSIYQKLIASHGIVESGSNFPVDPDFDIANFGTEYYYDSLRDAQAKHAEELEKKRQRINAKKEAALRKAREGKWDKNLNN